MAPSVRDIMAFHNIDRAAYDRLVKFGANPQLARNSVALLMWLELIGIDVVAHIASICNPAVIAQVVAEADAILCCLRQDSDGSPELHVDIPFVASMCNGAVDLRFFTFHKDVVVRGIANILDGVGAIIFDDNLHALLRMHEASGMHALPPELARPYSPGPVSLPEDCRSMFITFSKGFPLRREEIVSYFTEKWGNCIERVMMERTTAGMTPMYGRIIFKSESFIGLVLNGERLVKFVINGRQLWARKYVPRIT